MDRGEGRGEKNGGKKGWRSEMGCGNTKTDSNCLAFPRCMSGLCLKWWKEVEKF